MESKINEEHGFVKELEFQQLAEKANTEAMELFNKRATMGNKEKIEQHRQHLKDELNAEFERYKEENKARDPVALVANYIVTTE